MMEKLKKVLKLKSLSSYFGFNKFRIKGVNYEDTFIRRRTEILSEN